ncbi:DUF4437 domain-containing protein [Litoreibacter sp.]|nr:DUF4437 domain-containing protein [Litoreibacter sp.]
MKLTKLSTIVTLSVTALGLTIANATFADGHASPAIEQLDFQNGGPGLDFALLWGDWTKDEYAMVVRIKAGVAAPDHSHTFDYHGVTLQGNWVHTYNGTDDRVLTPGGYAHQPGKEVHGDRCEGTEDCLILIHQHGPRDFILPTD